MTFSRVHSATCYAPRSADSEPMPSRQSPRLNSKTTLDLSATAWHPALSGCAGSAPQGHTVSGEPKLRRPSARASVHKTSCGTSGGRLRGASALCVKDWPRPTLRSSRRAAKPNDGGKSWRRQLRRPQQRQSNSKSNVVASERCDGARKIFGSVHACLRAISCWNVRLK